MSNPHLTRIAIAAIDVPDAQDLRQSVDWAHVDSLAETIRELGLLQPISVAQHGDRYNLLAGRHRLEACKKLGQTTIDAAVQTDDDADITAIAYVENAARKNLSPMEEARALRRLVEAHDHDLDKLARITGRSIAWLEARLEMLLWPPAITEPIDRGRISIAVGKALLPVANRPDAADLVAAAIDHGVTAATARLWVQQIQADTPPGDAEEGAAGKAAQPPEHYVTEAVCHVTGERIPLNQAARILVGPNGLKLIDELRNEIARTPPEVEEVTAQP